MLRKLSSTTLIVGALLVGSVAAAGLSGAPVPQDSRSGPLAKQLAQALDAAKLDAVAAPDPSTGGFVAALYIPGTQLLVVSGKFENPQIGTHRIGKSEYRELYMDLMGASEAATRLFASDVSCDGFVFDPDGDAAADSWETGGKSFAFTGAKKAKLSDDDYLKAYTEADTQYAHILELLIAKLKPGTEY
ncbi:MAG TPA: hypothetical protein VGD94_23520 [Vicinamibacterales bacterium]